MLHFSQTVYGSGFLMLSHVMCLTLFFKKHVLDPPTVWGLRWCNFEKSCKWLKTGLCCWKGPPAIVFESLGSRLAEFDCMFLPGMFCRLCCKAVAAATPAAAAATTTTTTDQPTSQLTNQPASQPCCLLPSTSFREALPHGQCWCMMLKLYIDTTPQMLAI